MKVLIDIPDSAGPDLDRLRALVGDTAMVMTILRDDPARIIELFGIMLDHGHVIERLIARGVVVDENCDDVSDYVVIEPVRWPA
jgi:hypothetical protein